MAKFRKKPVVVEAVQWFPGVGVDGICSCDAAADAKPIGTTGGLATPADKAHLHTLEGPLTVSPGDWIITGTKGEKYPCKPDIFAATYEPAEET